MDEANLFERDAFARLLEANPEVERKERIVHDFYITLDGVRIDADDLYETLCAVNGNDVTTSFGEREFAVLKAHGILETQGSRRALSAARLGPNGNEFRKWLRDKIDKQMN